MRPLIRHTRAWVSFALIVAILAGSLARTPVAEARGILTLTSPEPYSYGDKITGYGRIEAIGLECSVKGTPDYVGATSDVWLVPEDKIDIRAELPVSLAGSGGVKVGLIAVTLGTTFDEQEIGLVANSMYGGDLKKDISGNYTVFIDHCQDGEYNAGQDYFHIPTFRIRQAAVPNDNEIRGVTKLKNDYQKRSNKWIAASRIMTGLAVLMVVVEGFLSAKQRISGMTAAYIGAAAVVIGGIATWLRDTALSYQALADDPPDPLYKQYSTLPARARPDVGISDPLLEPVMVLSEAAANEGAVAEMLLHSLERYQGAQLEGRLDWQLIHARALRSQIALLQDQIARSDSAAQELSDALAADPRPLDSRLAAAEELRQRLAGSGLTAEERTALLAMGLGGAQIDSFLAGFTGTAFNFTVGGIQAELADLRASGASLSVKLEEWTAEIDQLIAAIEADPRAGNPGPVARAGGPYTASAGTPITLDGSASTSPVPITAYEWDLDGDGAFDDATGAAPTVTFPLPAERLIGLRTVNDYGLENVDFAAISVGASNASPRFDSVSPSPDDYDLIVGETWPVAVAVSDPDGDPIAVEWLLDGTAVGSGPTYSYTPGEADIGLHVLQAVASNPGRPSAPARHSWAFGVGGRDVDGDGWRSHLDCNDNDPQVNPGMSEVRGNGKDDDCDSRTTDTGGAPNVFFNPQGGGRNVALLEGGASIHSFSNQANTGAAPANMINYATTGDNGWRTSGSPAAPQWAVVALAGGKAYQIDRVTLNPGAGQEALRQFEVEVATASADGPYTRVLEATAANDGKLQTFALSQPVMAKWVRLRALGNHGSPCCITVKQFKVYTGQEGGRTVSFANLTVDSENDVASWHWDFGDGQTSAEQSPTHTFPDASATYPVKLTATDSQGNSSTYTLAQRVLLPPVANFTVAPATPNEGAKGVYTDTSSDPDGEGMLATRIWSWSSTLSNTVTSPSIDHTYPDSGNFVVKLQVVDLQEQVTTLERVVTIANVPPTVKIDGPQTVVWGQNLSLAQSIVNDISAADRGALVCDWSWGDGTTSHIAPCNNGSIKGAHAYANPGSYTATVTVTDKDGGTASASLVATVTRRDQFVQPLSMTQAAGGQLAITAKLYDRYSWTPLAGRTITFSIGAATTTATTAADGTASVTLPRDPAAATVGVSVAGDSHYNPASMERPIEAPLGDVVFVIDESGSMQDDQLAVRQNLDFIAAELAARVDFRIGVVGFGAALSSHGAPNGHGHIEQTFSNDVGTTAATIRGLSADGGFEAGFDGVRVAMTDAMGFRPNAGVCAVLISDDWADFGGELPTTREDAVAALKSRNAIFLGIVHPGIRGVTDHYGMNPGSLAAETGGQTWHILDFRNNPQPVLDAILARCVSHIARPDLSVTVSDGVATARPGDTLTYTLTVENVSTGIANGIALANTIPTGASFVAASDGGTFAAGKVTWPAFNLAADQTATRSVTVKLNAGLAAGTTLTSTATVADNGQNGPDPTPANNTATDTTTVEAPANTAPVAADQQLSTDEETPVQITLAASDADGDALSYTVVDQPQHGTLGGAVPNLTYTPASGYTGADSFTFKVNDGTADSNLATVSIAVAEVNDAPTADAGGPYAVAEGGATLLAGAGSDPEGAALSFAWDLDGDGSFETPGQNVTLSAAGLNGPGSSAVALQVTDAGGLSATAQATVTIENVAPTAALTGANQIAEGGSATLSLEGAVDPSDADLAAGLRYAFACDGSELGGASYASAGTSPTATCTFDDGPASALVRARVFDQDGAWSEYTTAVEVTNIAPAATFEVPSEIVVGSSFALALSAPSDPSQADTAAGFHYTFDCGDGQGWRAPGTSGSVTCTAVAGGTITVKASLQDKDGASTQYSATLVANRLPPEIAAPQVAPQPSGEGQAVAASAAVAAGHQGDTLTCAVDYGAGGGFVAGSIDAGVCAGPQHTYADNGAYTVTVVVTDQSGASASSSVVHTVNNVAPVVAPIVAPAAPGAVGTALTVSAAFSDPGLNDTHSAVWQWGDGTSSTGAVSATGGSGTVSGSHTYTQAGVYQVTLTVTDKDGGVGQAVSGYLVAYDPAGGFVTGGGWIESPAGAYLADPTLGGRANFGFNVKYKNGESTPSGQTEFQLKLGDLNFHSTAYTWLVVNGSQAQFSGTGTISGAGAYNFTITVRDGQQSGAPDTFLMRIWDGATGNIIYDSQLGAPDHAVPTTPLQGGNIAIHSGK